MDNIHKDKFSGVDTSHFRRPKEGDTKLINDMTYVYLLLSGKLRLVPVREIAREIVQAVHGQG
jgi:hypothetical protein